MCFHWFQVHLGLVEIMSTKIWTATVLGTDFNIEIDEQGNCIKSWSKEHGSNIEKPFDITGLFDPY